MNNYVMQLKKNLDSLSEIGKSQTSGGITRLSYSPEYRQGQELVRKYMEAAGLKVTVDAIGNMIGEYEGTDKSLKPVMIGSHLDTVPEGGAFDGALGVMMAIECMQKWHDEQYRPARTVKVIATIEEEGTLFGMACFGVRALTGEFITGSENQIKDREGRLLTKFLDNMQLPQDPFSRVNDDIKNLHCF